MYNYNQYTGALKCRYIQSGCRIKFVKRKPTNLTRIVFFFSRVCTQLYNRYWGISHVNRIHIEQKFETAQEENKYDLILNLKHIMYEMWTGKLPSKPIFEV